MLNQTLKQLEVERSNNRGLAEEIKQAKEQRDLIKDRLKKYEKLKSLKNSISESEANKENSRIQNLKRNISLSKSNLRFFQTSFISSKDYLKNNKKTLNLNKAYNKSSYKRSVPRNTSIIPPSLMERTKFCSKKVCLKKSSSVLSFLKFR